MASCVSITRIYLIKDKNFIIFFDLMSSLEAVNGFKPKLDLVQKIIKDYTHLTNSSKTVVICWIPNHVNIRGNETADAVGSVTHSKSIFCRDSILINRLQIGHSRLTHSYLLSNDDVPLCESCGLPLTVKTF